MKRVNIDYLQLYKEAPLLLMASFKRKDKTLKNAKKVLIVNPCLVGEFAASLPAIRHFISKSRSSADIIVTSPVVPLAKRMKGIDHVFVSKSVFSRKSESSRQNAPNFDEYSKMIIMRGSSSSYKMIRHVRAGKVQTSFFPFMKYAAHLAKSLLVKKTPKGWREINFEMFKERNRRVDFGEIFNVTGKDYERILRLSPMKTKEKIIIIHTGASWLMNNWGNERWAELINKINKLGRFRFVFVGGGNETGDFEEIAKRSSVKIYSLIGKIDLWELLLLMRKSDYFIGVDSGPMNLAHLADLRSISILGPGPHMYMPSNKKDVVIDKSNGGGLYERFFYKKKGFIHKITADEVYRAFIKISNKR